jgi:hypothetical protein
VCQLLGTIVSALSLRYARPRAQDGFVGKPQHGRSVTIFNAVRTHSVVLPSLGTLSVDGVVAVWVGSWCRTELQRIAKILRRLNVRLLKISMNV